MAARSDSQPATWSVEGYGVQNTSFKRANGSPLMTQQSTCIYCVPSATTAWISYVWQSETGSDTGHTYTHQDFWDNYFGVTRKANSGIDTTSNTVTCDVSMGGTITYNRRLINDGKDDGVDPYGAAWGIFDYTPGSHYYNVNVYKDGVNATGYDYGTRGIALTLSRYSQPVGVLIDAGGHYVLGVAVLASQDPQTSFWGTSITKVYVRDPFNPVSTQLTAYATGVGSLWASHFSRYGYGNGGYIAPPHCPNCSDDAHVGFGAYGQVWWGQYVTVERGTASNTPDTLLRFQN